MSWLHMAAACLLAWAGSNLEARSQGAASSSSAGVAGFNGSRAVLLHRYSFNEKSGDTCHDSIGGENGKLMNGATFDGAGQVVLSNRPDALLNPQYVALPPGLITNFDALTFEIWITPAFDEQAPFAGWTRMWDFGNQGRAGDGAMVGAGRFFYSTTGNSSTKPRADTYIQGGENLWCVSSQELQGRRKNHWVWTAEATSQVQYVYLNGVVSGRGAWLSHGSDLIEGTTNNWLGRSQFARDPPLNGQIDEFRIYHGALSPIEVAANYQRGPDADPGEHGTATALRMEITNSLAAGEFATAALYASVSGLTIQINLTSNPGLLISFISADPKIATVDAAGKVVGISAGETEINASYGHVRASARVRVVQHLSTAGEPPGAGEPGVRTKSPGPTWLNLEGRCVGAGQFLPGEHLQDLMLPKAAVARYFCLESRSAFDGLPSAAVAELDLLDDQGRPLSHEGWRVCHADSEEYEGRNVRENVLDGNLDTAWVTQFSKANPNHPHRIILDLGKPFRISGFRYVPRRGWEGIQGRIKEYRVYAGDDLIRTRAHDWAFPARCFLFAYHQNDGMDGLHLACSLGGYRWEPLDSGRVFLKPKLGQPPLLRDPCLFRQTNGVFGLVWTMGMNGNAIGYASSTNLMDWSEQHPLPLMAGEPETLHCWAPKAFWDEHTQRYIILWASAVIDSHGAAANRPYNRIYAASTSDFSSFGPTRIISDQGLDTNDPAMLHAHGRYYLWSTLPSGLLSMVTADDPLGPFKNAHTPIEYGQLEGPFVFRLGGHYALLAHLLNRSRYQFLTFTSPDLEHWDETTAATTFPEGAVQGSVLEIPHETIRALVEAGRMELGAAPAAAELRVGDWIWTTNVTDRQSCRLWRDLTVPKPGVTNGELRITADDTYVAYLDGQQVGHGADANSLTAYDVTRLLSPGHHVLAVEALNEGMNAGVLAGLHMTLPDGHSVDVLSDNSWRVADNHDARWKTVRQSASSWIHAETVGYAGKDWWQYPRTIFNAPPLLPPVVHFWQRTWFVSLMMGLLVIGFACTVRQRLQLAVQNRSNRLLDDMVQQRTGELRKAREHLEEEVSQRTAELFQARAELEKVSRATSMGELAASIAHEVNQPLAGVVSSANASLNWMAANPPNLDKARESMTRVLRDGTRAGEVLNRIRELFRRSPPTRAPMSLNQVVQDVLALAGGELRQQKVELVLHLADPLPEIMGDSVQLQQVLLNLVRNGVEAMAEIEGRPKILQITSSLADLQGKRAVSVTVSDSGVGFAATEQKRLFEAFHTTKPQGMGMGLWISRSIVEGHGGTLTARPNAGPGATFEILIPVGAYACSRLVRPCAPKGQPDDSPG